VRGEHRPGLIADELVGAAVVNFAINAAIAWVLTRGKPSLPASALAGDTVVTAFVLPFITALVASPLVRFQVVRGLLPPLPAAQLGPWSRRSSIMRGAVVGVVTMLAVALPAVHFAVALPTAHFIWVKAAIAAALGALVTPLLGWWALQEASRAT